MKTQRISYLKKTTSEFTSNLGFLLRMSERKSKKMETLVFLKLGVPSDHSVVSSA